MVSATLTVTNPQGMHMRPAQLLVAAVTPLDCDVTILFNGQSINARSIMNLMAACIKQGSQIQVQCSGPQEEEALKKVTELVRSGLGDL